MPATKRAISPVNYKVWLNEQEESESRKSSTLNLVRNDIIGK
jgi:hypothetical protein